ncbi:glycine cleavage system protein R [Salinisphaera japonica]|uniref:Glycine cleavage system transcriptional repressor n=1 Tax=Salinisphaera japonica YTM-1 TaxID=1209778 RepID=A0A423PSR0_9GAMM|nr:ACT domain-containing protein [Salinisphaera japonica]ROO28592.1 amino acid-binding protein [Salinisphaera japonica YTM-1]
MPEIKKYLSLVALGTARERLAHDLIGAVARRGCAVEECRITPLGDHFSAVMLLAGNWSAMGKMASALPGLAETLGLSIQFEHTEPGVPAPDYRPYAAEVVGPQQPRTLGELVAFFSEQDVLIHELSVQAYDAGMTGAAMCTVHMSLRVPINQHPQTLRDAFMDICDDLNADGLLDPIKT